VIQPTKQVKTEVQKADIQARWDERKKQNALISKTADNVLQVAKAFPEIDATTLKELVKSGNMLAIERETEALAKALSAAQKEERELSVLIPDIKRFKQQFTIAELRGAFDATKATMNRFSALGDAELLKELKSELKYAERNISLRRTMPVAVEVYKKAIADVERRIRIKFVDDKVKSLESVLTTTKSKLLEKDIAAIKDAIATGKTDTQIDALITKADSRVIALQTRKVKGGKTLETLKDLEPLQNQYLLKIKRHLGLSDAEFAKLESDFKNEMLDLFDKNDFGMRVGKSGSEVQELKLILASKFKNQIELDREGVKSSGGWHNPKGRADISKEMFGTASNTAAKNYEKYGYLMDRDMLREAQAKVGEQYGNLFVRFKKDKVNATFSIGDSLFSSARPSLVTDPKLTSFLHDHKVIKDIISEKTGSALDFMMWVTRSKESKSYVELQYHGELGIDAIESLFIPEEFLAQLKSTLMPFKGKFKVFTVFTKRDKQLVVDVFKDEW
jgi:hypothetical protein